MRERPIIFSTEMVRAILEGRKTMTRRVIKPQPLKYLPDYDQDGMFMCAYETDYNSDTPLRTPCPCGQAGDRLWVRETGVWEEASHFRAYRANMPEIDRHMTVKWQPSIHMPRWASRITLEIVKVRVERVQEITDAGAVREGIPNGAYAVNQITSFARLWDSLNAKRGYSWGSNPWVWVIEFKKLEGE